MDWMKTQESDNGGDIWIITRGRYLAQVPGGVDQGAKKGLATEYHISELARYLLDPNPIEVRKRLVGCQILYPRTSFNRLTEKIEKLIPGSRSARKGDSETFIVDSDMRAPLLKDPDLESHVNKIYEQLMTYDQTLERLSSLDREKISDVLGLCDDPDGSRSWLKLQGGIDDKMRYIHRNIGEEIGVRLEKCHTSEGLFEMRGFDFPAYDAENGHRLIKIFRDGKPEFCVLDPNDEVAFWVENIRVVHYMQLLQQSISMNRKLKESLKQCIEGRAKPLKLFFNSHIEVTYSGMHLPETYRNVFAMYNMGPDERNAIVSSLNSLQFGILFNYLPESSSGENRLFSNLSVMHDFRALEAVKDHLPQLYSEINKRVLTSEAGSFYLLDSLGGYKDAQ